MKRQKVRYAGVGDGEGMSCRVARVYVQCSSSVYIGGEWDVVVGGLLPPIVYKFSTPLPSSAHPCLRHIYPYTLLYLPIFPPSSTTAHTVLLQPAPPTPPRCEYMRFSKFRSFMQFMQFMHK
jgi:hypothetical protein